MKMFSLCLNQVELAVFTLYISTTKLLVQSVVLIKRLLNKLYLTFLFSPFCLRTLIPKCTYTVFKNECSQFKNNLLEYFSFSFQRPNLK